MSKRKRIKQGGSSLWLYGRHAVAAAWANPARDIRRILVTAQTRDALEREAGAGRHGRNVPVESAGKADIAALLPAGAVHQGAAAETAPLPAPDLDGILAGLPRDVAILVLDQITDPQNFGAILRSAAAFGAAAVVTTEAHAPPETGALARAASGALEVVPVVRVANLARAMDRLTRENFWRIGLDGEAEKTLAELDLSGRVALVLGAEGKGLRRLTREHCDFLARLPISGRIESLNVSAAAAVALYELARG